ncbi:hypothetical protein J5226_12215 [Lysobacter sp. K5869]|uniref:hypothetical protein n=1 Tax=Lysobacter sp. K5869 TaxID=2820808 RepID=UPI001C060AD1|nr:hypothetical protein [Lysobacter sp. K5869]QWP79096.1 hypothetical protein J5226_12215 [Lysobacter sp. K5869]
MLIMRPPPVASTCGRRTDIRGLNGFNRKTTADADAVWSRKLGGLLIGDPVVAANEPPIAEQWPPKKRRGRAEEGAATVSRASRHFGLLLWFVAASNRI